MSELLLVKEVCRVLYRLMAMGHIRFLLGASIMRAITRTSGCQMLDNDSGVEPTQSLYSTNTKVNHSVGSLIN